jgi:hypothetical protein
LELKPDDTANPHRTIQTMIAFDALKSGDPAAIGTCVALTTLSLYALYRRLLPKPIPGIPYNKEATGTIFGDLPALVKAIKSEDGNFSDWMNSQTTRHNSPICQIFINFPSSRPSVIIADAQESQDILLRRTREFDRSVFTTDFLEGILPKHHIRMMTDDKFKAQRRLLQDLMTPSFLRNVASKVIHDKATDLVELWEAKAAIARGRPFSVEKDVFHFALEAVVAFSFGGETGHVALEPHTKLLTGLSDGEKKKLGEGGEKDDAIVFPHVDLDDEMQAALTLTETLEKILGFPFPTLLWRLMEWTTIRKPTNAKNRFIRRQLAEAVARLERSENQDNETWIRSAVDLIVSRERRYAAKDERKPSYMTRGIQDEVR